MADTSGRELLLLISALHYEHRERGCWRGKRTGAVIGLEPVESELEPAGER